MEVTSKMMVPDDVPFDERLFESNSMLKQYWETSVGGRSSMMVAQRAAEEDDLKTESLALYDSLVYKSMAPTEDLEHAAVVEAIRPLDEPAEVGPILLPKAIENGIVWWQWLLIAIGILLLVVVVAYTYSYRRGGFFAGGEAVAIEAVAAPIEGGARGRRVRRRSLTSMVTLGLVKGGSKYAL